MAETLPSVPAGHRPVPRWFTRLTDLGLALLKPFLPARWISALRHGAWFIAIGGFNTICGYLLFVAFLNLLQLSRVMSLFLAYFSFYFVAYYLFSRFVFTGGSRGALLRFAPSQVIVYGSNQLLLEVFVRLSHWPEELCQLLLLPAVAVISYMANRLIVFRHGQG
jgi:putative flippase GtrA